MLVRFQRFPVLEGVSAGMVDDLFADIMKGGLFDRGGVPALDVAESDSELVIVAEIPGVRKDDVKVTLEEGVLTISGERKPSGLPDGARWHRTETAGGAFSRSFALPVPVNASSISAELKDGLLRISLPKAEEARAREIKVH